jgi:hypothetical protein
MCLVRDKLEERHPRLNTWFNSIVMVNASVKLQDCYYSCFVCDGDVELLDPCFLQDCIVIANGSIRFPVTGFAGPTCLWASGDIELSRNFKGPSSSCWHAGGKIYRTGEAKELEGKSGLKENPFGIRFLHLAELGLEVKHAPSGMTVVQAEPTSMFAKYDVRQGDRIMKINGSRIDSDHDLRRALRQCVIQELGTFEIRREERTLTRLVFFREAIKPSPITQDKK